MAYLDCPRCRLTVDSRSPSVAGGKCPRCGTGLGKVRRLFRSPLPARLVKRRLLQ